MAKLQRGMYIVVRVPTQCMPSGSIRVNVNGERAIEILVTNYEVVYGRHPSGGALYQPVMWVGNAWSPIGVTDVGGEGEVITCSELSRLISVSSSLSGTEGRSPEELAESGEEVINLPKPERHWEDEEKDAIYRIIWQVWSIPEPHYHDFAIFGLASLARRAGGVASEDVLNILDRICTQAINQGLDSEKTCKEHKSVVEWVYERPKKLWSRKSFEKNIKPALDRLGLDVDTTLSTLYEAIGYQSEAPLCIPLVRHREVGNSRIVSWICNNQKMGIIVRNIQHKRRRNGDEVIDVIAQVENILLPFYLTSVVKYRDILFK